MIVEFSRFSDLVKESDDQGGIDICANPTYRGNLFRYNRWENIVGGSICGAAAIRFDDMISGQVAYGNLFVHCGDVNFGAIQIHGGKDNLVENNVALDCRAMVSFQPWGDLYVQSLSDPKSLRYGGLKNACHRDVEIDSPLWRERYPELGNLVENVDRNFTRNNLMVNCRGDFIRSGDSSTFENNIFENNHVENLPDATEEEVTDPEFLARFGLKPIPIDQFGVKAPPYLPE